MFEFIYLYLTNCHNKDIKIDDLSSCKNDKKFQIIYYISNLHTLWHNWPSMYMCLLFRISTTTTQYLWTKVLIYLYQKTLHQEGVLEGISD